MSQKKTNWQPLFWMLLLFSAPLIAAYLLYYGYLPGFSSHSRGELVKPWYFSELSIPEQKRSALQGKWGMVWAKSKLTNQDTTILRDLARLHDALNKNAKRVARGVITLEDPQWDYYDNAQTVMIMKTFDGTHLQDNALYLVDPRGQVVLQYAPKWSRDDIYHDIKRLLKVSKIG